MLHQLFPGFPLLNDICETFADCGRKFQRRQLLRGGERHKRAAHAPCGVKRGALSVGRRLGHSVQCSQKIAFSAVFLPQFHEVDTVFIFESFQIESAAVADNRLAVRFNFKLVAK